jgi:hypothetical protein
LIDPEVSGSIPVSPAVITGGDQCLILKAQDIIEKEGEDL